MPQALPASPLQGAQPASAQPQRAFPYDLYCDKEGNLTDNVAALLQELRKAGWTEVIYEDAVRGEPRAQRFYSQLEEVFAGAGEGIAERMSEPYCVVADILPGCRPHWEWLDFLDREQPGPARLREVTAIGFARRAKELKIQRKLVEAALSMVLAGAALDKVLAIGEGNAAARTLLDGTLAKMAEATGLAPEVLAAKLAEAEAVEAGARMTADLAALERLRPEVNTPPPGTQAQGLWREYVVYWGKRFDELTRAKHAAASSAESVKPPLQWDAYSQLRNRFAKGIEYQRAVAAKMLEEVKQSPGERKLLASFRKPLVHQNVGVSKGKNLPTRYADQLVIELDTPQGKPPRVETFSNKCRDMTGWTEEQVKQQVEADARSANEYYGGELDIVRPELKMRVKVQKVHLVYDAKTIPPDGVKAVSKIAKELAVEVHFQ